MKNYQAKFLGKKWNIFQKEITSLTTRIKQLNTVKKDTDLTESESREIELEIHDLKEIKKISYLSASIIKRDIKPL